MFLRDRYCCRDHSRPRYSSVPRTAPSQFHNSGMKTKTLTLPEITFIGGTRVALGLGLGLLLSDRLSRDARKGAGWALLAVGVLTTVPLVIHVLKKPDFAERA